MPPFFSVKMEAVMGQSVGCFGEKWLYGCDEEGLNVEELTCWVIYPTDDGDNIPSVGENLKCSRL